MHAMDHGNEISIYSGVVKRLQALAEELGLARGFFVTKLTDRLYRVCDSHDRRHLQPFLYRVHYAPSGHTPKVMA
jgi:hypothetical protein